MAKMSSNEIKYQRLMQKADQCTIKAMKYAKKNDCNMMCFFIAASNGFKQKAYALKSNGGKL